ncbi:hypothetical protein TSUD_157520 [Trifolium subterraneum]|uniref:Uncharacterized protein n=1 Tax=Trifolium subterraneum TaxID=3900 RepID=A0A2Z6N0A6_TRISU|nr:hypothetical protein TSUD_157520 [Trifolium subterraneum]
MPNWACGHNKPPLKQARYIDAKKLLSCKMQRNMVTLQERLLKISQKKQKTVNASGAGGSLSAVVEDDVVVVDQSIKTRKLKKGASSEVEDLERVERTRVDLVLGDKEVDGSGDADIILDNTMKQEEIKELRRSQATWVEQKTKLEDFLKSSGNWTLDREVSPINGSDELAGLNRATLIAKIHNLEGEMLNSAQESFDNALAQVKCLNPEIELKTEGMSVFMVIDGDHLTLPVGQDGSGAEDV